MTRNRILILSIIGILIIVTIVFTLIKGGIGSSEAEKYYKEQGKIVSKVKVMDSKTLQTEAQVYEDMKNRGFSLYPIVCDFSLNGNRIDETEISTSSEEKHPVYQTYYAANNENLWSINIINGVVTAYPMFYNEKNTDVEVLVTETDYYTGYDIKTGYFFDVIPNEESMKLLVVKSIDAGTLDGLTKEVIDNEKS